MKTSDGAPAYDHRDPAKALAAVAAQVGAAQRRMLEGILACEEAEVWLRDDCRDLAQWLSLHLGISQWAARRLIAAAQSLPRLPQIAAALEAGTLGLDKTCELCRFATPETEARLLRWARRGSLG